jgi:hypothetical protein
MSSMSDKRFREYSAEHLWYEIAMFLDMGTFLRHRNISTQAEKNAYIESFVIHMRNLIAFLYPVNAQKGDVIAADFFLNPGDWSKLRSPISTTLKQARTRAHKEISHLTTKRISGTPRQKAWAIAGLTNEILIQLKRFAKGASAKRLDASVTALLARY